MKAKGQIDIAVGRETIKNVVHKLLVREAEERPIELHNHLMEIKDKVPYELRPMFTSCIKYLQGFEIIKDTPEEKTITILSNKKGMLGPTTRVVIALDIQTGSIITLVNSDKEAEISASKISNIKMGDVIKVTLRKVSHKELANTYTIHGQNISYLGQVNRFLRLFDKYARYDEYLKVCFDRSDYDRYCKCLNFTNISEERYPISEFTNVLTGTFEVKQKRIRYFLVNFTKSQIRPHKTKPRLNQILMYDNFVTINFPISRSDIGKYFKGVALLRCHTLNNGKNIYFAEEHYGGIGDESDIKKWENNSSYGVLDFNGEENSELEYDYVIENDDKYSLRDELLDELVELINQENDLEDSNGLAFSSQDYSEDDEPDDGNFDDVAERILINRSKISNLMHELEEQEHEDFDEMVNQIEQELWNDDEKILNKARVYVVSDTTDDRFALDFNKVTYEQHKERYLDRHKSMELNGDEIDSYDCEDVF